jgi:hypothetical protein
MNLTKTVQKSPIDLDLKQTGAVVADHATHKQGGPKYDAEDMWVSHDGWPWCVMVCQGWWLVVLKRSIGLVARWWLGLPPI